MKMAAFVLTTLLALAHSSREARAQHDVATAIAMALDSVWVVALGENHGHVEFHGLVIDMLEDPQIQARVNDIVVEFGNSLYQPTIDRYIAGGDVAMDSVRLAWRNTVVSPNLVWDSPVYERFYQAVRRINQERADGGSYRLVLGDSPIDWTAVGIRDDLLPFYDRSESIASVVGREVLRHGRRALLIAGGAHLSRVNMVRTNQAGVRIAEVSVVSRLQTRFPGSLFVIRSLARTGSLDLSDIDRGAEPALWMTSAPSIGSHYANAVSTMKNMDGSDFDAYGTATLRDMVDAVIVWPREQVTIIDADASSLDEAYWNELNRRSTILRGRPMDAALRSGK